MLGLLQAGYLARRHGSGTYVTKAPRSRHALDTTVSYTAMIREAGHEPSVTVISKSIREPTEHEHALLDLAAGAEVLELERVRLADDRPVIYSRDRIPAALVADVPDAAFDGSLVRGPGDVWGAACCGRARSCCRRWPTRSSRGCWP